MIIEGEVPAVCRFLPWSYWFLIGDQHKNLQKEYTSFLLSAKSWRHLVARYAAQATVCEVDTPAQVPCDNASKLCVANPSALWTLIILYIFSMSAVKYTLCVLNHKNIDCKYCCTVSSIMSTAFSDKPDEVCIDASNTTLHLVVVLHSFMVAWWGYNKLYHLLVPLATCSVSSHKFPVSSASKFRIIILKLTRCFVLPNWAKWIPW